MATNPVYRKRKTSAEIDWFEFSSSIFLTFVGGWLFMLLIGIVHHEWLHNLPTLGYWPSLLIFFMADWVITLLRWHSRTVPIGTNSKVLRSL